MGWEARRPIRPGDGDGDGDGQIAFSFFMDAKGHGGTA
jgi:hypothetical protein